MRKKLKETSREPHDPTWDFKIGNYKLYSGAPFYLTPPVIAVSNDCSEEVVRKLVAVLKSNLMRIESVDYTLKTYGKAWKIESPKDKINQQLFEIIGELKFKLENFLKQHAHGVEEDILGMPAASSAFERCLTTFYSAFSLLAQGCFLESLVLCRYILEQTAFGMAVHKMNNIDEIEKLMPQSTQSISSLAFHPTAKRLYGVLSKYVHLSAKYRYEYLTIKNGKSKIIHKSNKHALRVVPLLIRTLDIYIAAYEKICIDHYNNVQSWKLDKEGKWLLDSKRPLEYLFNKHKKKLTSKTLFH